MADKPAASENNQRRNWLQHILDRWRERAHGDLIAGQVGEGAQNVVVGKNIIQIGGLQVPIWVLLLISALLLTLALLLAYQVLSPLWPRAMPEGSFNIAVAQFDTVDMTGKSINSPDARELASRIAGFINEQKDTIGKIHAAPVEVWGPAERVGRVAEGQEAEKVKNLNAHVLLYGKLRQVAADRWELEPQFYLAEDAVQSGNESLSEHVGDLVGKHALGRAITYRNDVASRRDVTDALRIRVEALAQMLIALAYLSHGEQSSFQRATETLQIVAQESAWGQSKENTGQEILYLFLGNAYIQWATLMQDSALERVQLLDQALAAFTQAITYNPNYARSYNGLGSVHFQRARALDSADMCAWNWDELEQARLAYNKALSSPENDKPASGYVDYRAHLGLGRYHFWQGNCPDPAKGDQWATLLAEWSSADGHYQNVIETYEKMAEPAREISLLAAFAHTDLGFIALIQANNLRQQGNEATVNSSNQRLQQALDHYTQAFDLTLELNTEQSLFHARTFLPYYLFALCKASDGKRAATVLGSLVQRFSGGEAIRQAIIDQYESNGASWKECIDGSETFQSSALSLLAPTD